MKFYLSTSIAYTNSRPHAGFAMELVQGDMLCRYHRLIGDTVFFLTGTDEHGMKMAQAAEEQNITPQQLSDANSNEFRRVTEALTISNDFFIRTTSSQHIAGVQKLWRLLTKADALYKGTYEGLYCVGCEAYVTGKDLVNGNCPNHLKPPAFFKEENYFFRYSRYLPRIKKLIEEGQLVIVPESRRNEMLALIETGMEEGRDVSFSRPSETLSWGITVPDDRTQTMYVWCDALSNYLTGVGFADENQTYKTFWPADVHLIGKDILRFHAGIWIAMLLAAQLPIPRSIYVHGYITSEGQKMSKSLGNVVDPFEVINEWGVDALRYYLLRGIPTTDDGDFSRARFAALYGGELANNLGNLVSRVLTMTEKYAAGKVPAIAKDEVVVNEVLKTWREYQTSVAIFNLKAAVEHVFRLSSFANEYIEWKKPWELAKKNPVEALAVLYNLLGILRHLSLMLKPILPETAGKIQEALHWNAETLYPENIQWGVLKEGTAVSKIPSLFPRKEV